jgi:hypothetical protein
MLGLFPEGSIDSEGLGSIMNVYQSFVICRRASVATVFALVLPVLLGFTALVAEFGSILVTEANNQRVADLASYSGALAYNSASSGKEAAALAAAQRIATMNNVSTSYLSVTYPTSIKTAGATSVKASITAPYTLLIARVLNSSASVPVTTDAYTEISGGAASCILALSSTGTGVTMSGGTSLTAPTCAVNSNNQVSASCGTTITASALTYGTTLTEGCSNITANPKVQQTTTDPLAGNATVAALANRITDTVNGQSQPTAPAVPTGTDVSFAYSNVTLSNGCTATRSGGNHTVTCPAGGTYNFGALTMGGGTTLSFDTSGTGSSTYNFSGVVNLTGSTHTFGPGTYNLAQGLKTGGGTTTTFGAGTYRIGQLPSSVSGCNARYSVCHTGTSLTFRGPSTFEFSAGLAVTGGTTTRLGFDSSNANTTGNSYWFGKSSGNDAVNTGGGVALWMADAMDSGKVFKVSGNFNADGGGACTMIPAAANHDIDGNLMTRGALKLGAGIYSIDGYMSMGDGGGGSANCNGETVSVKGIDVTIVLSGSSTCCSGRAFYSGAGYSNVVLKAPTTGTYEDLLVIGPQNSAQTGAGFFGEGSDHGVLNGIFYFPNGTMTMSGGSSVADQAGGCLQVIATSITIAQGAAMASACIGGSGSVTAKLVR